MKKGIRYYCYGGHNGLCIAAKNYILSLVGVGYQVDVRFINKYDIDSEDPLYDMVNINIKYDVVIAHSLCNRYKEISEIENGKYIIGLAVWETTKLSKDYVEALQYVDELILPCKWNVPIFKRSFSGPISVIPHVISSDLRVDPLMINHNKFMFYFIGEWCERKNIEGLIKCFNVAFGNDKNIILYIKTFMFHNVMSERDFKRYKRSFQRHNVIINSDEVEDEMIASIHRRGDCFISLSAGEGVGIPLCDAAYHGNMIVTMNFGGFMEYVRDPIIISHQLVTANPCSSYHVGCGNTCKYYSCYDDGQQMWAQYDEQEVISTMQDIVKGQITKRAYAPFTRDNFNEANIGKKFISLIK